MTTEYRRGDYLISTDRTRLDIDVIHTYLCGSSYWAAGRPREVVEKSIAHSLCFGMYAGEQQIGFARLVTDHATFAWLCDVFILESQRGRDLGKWLVECIVDHPTVRSLRIVTLATRDAHELYRRHGRFQALATPENWMARVAPEQRGDRA